MRGRLGKLILCSDGFKSYSTLFTIFMTQTPSNYRLADHLCMGILVLVLRVFAWGFSMHGLLYVVQPAGGAGIKNWFL